jgi:Flp pilus assembly pilin Flp
MDNLYDFLNSQNGATLFWYGVFIVTVLSIIVAGIQGIFKSYFNRNKPVKSKGKNKSVINDD